MDEENVSIFEILEANLRLMEVSADMEICSSIRHEGKLRADGYRKCINDIIKMANGEIAL